MKIPFLSLREVNLPLEAEILHALERVVKSGWYIMGRECVQFEKDFVSDLNAEGFAVACNSGTDALILSLKAAGIQPGDEVITVAHTAIPTVAAIVNVGATPVFVDIDANTWVMDINVVEKAVTARTKAIIPVHLYGNMVDVEALRKLLIKLDRTDIVIIEDCAQAQGAYLNGQQAGTLGDFGAFSFYPSKNIGALGDGGLVFTRKEEHYKKLMMLRNYGQKDRYNAELAGGMNSRLDEMQAAILDIKLKYIHDWNKKKADLMERYRQTLEVLPLTFQKITPACIPAWHLCVTALNDKFRRDEVQQQLGNLGLQTLIHYPIPAHQQIAFKQYCQCSLPNTENLSARILSLPFSYVLSDEELAKVSDLLKKVLI